jgi:hypothetical protein
MVTSSDDTHSVTPCKSTCVMRNFVIAIKHASYALEDVTTCNMRLMHSRPHQD